MTTSKKKYKIRNVILDLDETLISAVETQDLQKYKAKNDEFLKRRGAFKYHTMDTDYIIVERPGVQKFLDFLFKHFNVSVWTAASKDYALFVIDNVIRRKPGRDLDLILHGNHCDFSKNRSGCLKQLNQLFHLHQYNTSNTLIVDDNKNVYEKQKNIVLRVAPFQFFRKDSEADDKLKGIQEKITSLCNSPKK